MFKPTQLLSVMLGSALLALPLSADLIISSPTSEWTPVSYSGSTPDPFDDQQTGQNEGDLIGNADHPAFYTKFDDAGTSSLTDGTLAFRTRLSKGGTFNDLLFVGIDADMSGSLDLFVGLNFSGNKNNISIWNPGNDLNTSPSTTSIETPALISFNAVINSNYHYAAVSSILDPTLTTTDVDGSGDTDYFLSFSIDFQTLVTQFASLPNSMTIDQNSPMTYVFSTSTQQNSMNMDLGGVGKNYDGNATWAQLGAVSDTITPEGQAVPEPYIISLLAAGYAGLFLTQRLIRWRNWSGEEV